MDAKKDTGFGIEQWLMDNPVAAGGLMGAVTDLAGAKGKQAGLEQQIAMTQYSPWTKTGPGDINPYLDNGAFNKTLQGMTAGMIDKKNRDYQEAMLKKLDTFKTAPQANNTVPLPATVAAPSQELQQNPYAPQMTPQDSYVWDTASMANSDDIVGKMGADMYGMGVKNPNQPVRAAPTNPWMLGGYMPMGGSR